MSNFVSLLVGNFGSKILGAIAVIFLARYLGANAFGDYSAAVTIAALSTVLINFGSNTYIIREMSLQPRSSILPAVFGAKSVIFLAILPVFFFVPKSLGYPTTVTALLGWALGLMFLSELQEVFFSHQQARQDMHLQGWLQFAIGCFTLVFTLAVGLRLTPRLMLQFSTGLFALILLLLAFSLRRFCVGGLSLTSVIAVVRECLPYSYMNIGIAVYSQVAMVLLPILTDNAMVGQFGAAYRIVSIVYLIGNALYTVHLPKLCQAFLRPGEEFVSIIHRFMVSSIVVGLPLGVGLLLVGPRLAPLLFGETFMQSGPVLGVLGIAVLMKFVSFPGAAVLTASNRQHQRTRITMVIAVVSVVINAALIWLYGAIGAAAATVAIEASLAFLYTWYARKVVSLVPIRVLVPAFIGCLAMAIAVLCLKAFPVLAVISIGAILYLFVVFRWYGSIVQHLLQRG